ncbi:MAG: DUF2279 domain-containing protein [Vicingus serpentipes]|nr:DUF2279 domain-containing protein [Vicingus serpentipes]
MLKIVFIFYALFISYSLLGQNYNDTLQQLFHPIKFGVVAGGGSLFYAGTLASLYTIWYQDKSPSPFHFKNDNAGWKQIDKYGHAYTCYLFGKLGMNSLKWTGVNRKKAIWFGGSYGFLFMTSIEILDGHYWEWGASPMDMVANASGGLLLIAQELAFNKQILTYKFSYHHTELANIKPGVLGDSHLSRVVEDYNGQTFWLSLNLKSVFKHQKSLPSWLNIAGGYGAYGMLSGETNPTYVYYKGAILPPIERYRSYYLTLDIDFDKIKTNSKFLRSTFFFLNLIKFPLPTVEFNTLGETKFHPFFF